MNAGSGRAHDHRAAGESDRDGGTDGDLHGGGERHGAVELPVAEEWRGHRRSDVGELHDACDDDGRQRIDIHRDGEQRNSVRNATSSAATLTVNAGAGAPTITAQPASQTVTAGQTATFAVTASGTAPFSYQWQKNAASIAGATFAELHDAGDDDGRQRIGLPVMVSNGRLRIDEQRRDADGERGGGAPTITAQPASQTVTAGQTATFSVTASGTAPLSYQWQKNAAAIAGATASQLHDACDDHGRQRIDIHCDGEQRTLPIATSSAATLTVNAARSRQRSPRSRRIRP